MVKKSKIPIDWNTVIVKGIELFFKYAVKYFFIFKCVEQLSGKNTIADMPFLKTLFSEGGTSPFYIVIIVLLGGWGYLERFLRHKKTENLQKTIKSLELKIHPDRSSSGLTPHGKTNPKDE